MKNYIIIILFISIFSSCLRDRIDKRQLKIINTTSSDIYSIKSENGKLQKPYYNYYLDSIRADSTYFIENLFPSWNELIERSTDKKLTIFIIPKDSVYKYGWDKVYKNKIFIKRYLIDMKYLEDNKWTILYK